MKTEISAGGIIVRKKNDIWEVLVVRDMNNELTFPKGVVEQGEDTYTAAVREIAEEVGITKVEMILKLPVIRYVYKKTTLISKTVHYFLFITKNNEPLTPQQEEGIHDPQWMPLDRALQIIGYQKTNKPLLLQVKQWTLHPHRT